MTTATAETTNLIADAMDFFRSSYTHTLIARLFEFAQEGEIDEKITADGVIDGDILTGCDERAFSDTRSEYGWRLGTNVLDEAFMEAGADVYEGIDWNGIIETARRSKQGETI